MRQFHALCGRARTRRLAFIHATLCLAIAAVVTPRVARAHEGAHADLVRLSERLERAPESVPLRLARIDLLLREGRLSEAMTEAALLEWLSSRDPRVPFVRAQVLFAAGDAVGAEAELLVLEDRAGLGFQGYWLLGRVREALERPADAIFALDAALAEAPHADAALMRARLQRQLGDLGAARDGLMEVLLQMEENAVLRREVMRLSVRLGDTRAALAQVDALLVHARAQGALLLERGHILRLAGDTKAAQETFMKAVRALSAQLEVRPSAASFISRALAHDALGHEDAANLDARTAIQMSPDMGRLPRPFTRLAQRLGLRLRTADRGGR